jgi:ferredoxin
VDRPPGHGDGHAAPSAAERTLAAERARQLAAAMQRKPIASEWAAALEQSFAAPLWEALGRRCLGCSICSYVCPSCSCFDVQDSGNAWCGERCRSWDSCTFGLFTRHASGHNPRAAQPARYRQRVLHKFAYYPAQHEGAFMCVGCGRCVAMCPVGMNIEESVHAVVTASGEGRDARG